MVKLAYGYGADAVSVLLLRMLFALPFYVVVSLLQKPVVRKEVKGKDYLSLVGFGFIGYYLASYFDFQGLIYIKAGLERLILFVYPTLVFVLSFLFLGKRITKNQRLGILITYLGVVVVFSSELSANHGDRIIFGGVLIFLSALTYAGYLVGSGWLIPRFGATRFTSYAMIVSCTCVVIHYTLTSPSLDLLGFPKEVYWIGVCMAVFATVLPSYFISFSIKTLGAGNFSILGSLGPVSTILLAYVFLDETLTVIQIIGAVIVISGVIVGERKKKVIPLSKD